jgi:hypothetical protein
MTIRSPWQIMNCSIVLPIYLSLPAQHRLARHIDLCSRGAPHINYLSGRLHEAAVVSEGGKHRHVACIGIPAPQFLSFADVECDQDPAPGRETEFVAGDHDFVM